MVLVIHMNLKMPVFRWLGAVGRWCVVAKNPTIYVTFPLRIQYYTNAVVILYLNCVCVNIMVPFNDELN